MGSVHCIVCHLCGIDNFIRLESDSIVTDFQVIITLWIVGLLVGATISMAHIVLSTIRG